MLLFFEFLAHLRASFTFYSYFLLKKQQREPAAQIRTEANC